LKRHQIDGPAGLLVVDLEGLGPLGSREGGADQRGHLEGGAGQQPVHDPECCRIGGDHVLLLVDQQGGAGMLMQWMSGFQ